MHIHEKGDLMHDVLRERIWRHLESLPEDRVYQVLDYIEFLSSKYAREPVRPPNSPVQRLEDKLRGNRVGFSAIKSTLEVVGTADRMMSGIAEAGRSLLREVGGTSSGSAPAPSTPPRKLPASDSDDNSPVDG
jgi:hypothetical protein